MMINIRKQIIILLIIAVAGLWAPMWALGQEPAPYNGEEATAEEVPINAVEPVEEPVLEPSDENRIKAVESAREGDFEAAYELIRQSLSANPDSLETVADYIAIAAWAQKYEEAVKVYREYEGQELSAYAMKEVIRSLREMGNYDESIRLARLFLVDQPEDLDAIVSLIYGLIQKGDYQQALAALEEARNVHLGAPRLESLSLLILALEGQWAEFLKHETQIKDLLADSDDAGVLSDLDRGFYLVFDEAISLARSGEYAQALDFLDKLSIFKDKSQKILTDRMVILIWQERFDQALKEYAGMTFDYDPPPYFLKEVARAYREIEPSVELSEQHKKYIDPYLQALEEEIYESRLRLAFIRSAWEEGRAEDAIKMIDKMPQDDPVYQEALFLEGEIYDVSGDYWKAVGVYNRILGIYPGNPAALNLKLRSLMDLGASSLVVEAGEEYADVVDPLVLERARTDMTMHRINWEEPKQALDEIEAFEEEYARRIADDENDEAAAENNERVRWDRFLALRKETRMREIVDDYEYYLAVDEQVPPWVRQSAADAYLYLEKPEKALDIFNELLEADRSFDLRMSKYYTLVELGRYKEAEAELEQLEAETPSKVIRRGILQDNWQKADIAFNKAWLLMYQDRLHEAEKYIQQTKKVSPFNTDLRTAEAHNHLYRGWRRRALEDFRIVRTMDEKLISARIGYARALNENMFKKEAREEVKAILEEKPKNKHAKRLKRQFDVEEMATVTFNANYLTEDPGEDEFELILRGEQPIGYHHTLFAEVIRRETTQEGGNDVARRARVGDIWRINNNWQLTGALTGDYEKHDGYGFMGAVLFEPNDYWVFNFEYESDTLDIASRSRANGIEADKYDLSTTYRMSELFDTTLGVSFKDFSDDNEYFQYYWRTDTALTTSAYWKTRLGTDFSYETFSDQGVDYFSPEETYSFTLIPMVEHTWFRRYEKAWVDRMYLGLGKKWQEGYGTSDVGYIRYEQDHKFSDTKSWLIGTQYGLNEYDGEGVNALNVYTTLQFKF